MTDLLSNPRRIVIFGNAGSGKSTLAQRVGVALDLPVVHLDALFWQPNWVEPEREQFRLRVTEAAKGERWVMEGNYYSRTADIRLPRSDLVIRLDMPRALCASRVIRRSVIGGDRPDLAPGCHEKINGAYFAFLRYVWTFDEIQVPKMQAALRDFAGAVPVVTLRRSIDVEAFVQDISRLPCG
jgi:adenylate kinase family enzyme